MKKLKRFLISSLLVDSVLPTADKLVEFLNKNKENEIKLFYGETYDEFGVTVDSLKYYFTLSLLHKYLENEGFRVSSTVIQADVASLLNKSVQEKKDKLVKQKQQRQELLDHIITVYHLPVQSKLMSDIFESHEFKKQLQIVNEFTDQSKQDKKYYQLLEKTVLQNRINQEYQTKFRYAREAIATSMLFDIKLGPPREQFYDQAQQLIAQETESKSLNSIYLSPTYPLGQNFAYFLNHPEIEKFGLTPYKAGSNKLQDFRLIIGKTSQQQLGELIKNSFESNNNTAHPVLEMYLIGDLAQKLKQRKYELPVYNDKDLLANIEELRVKAVSKTRSILEEFSHDE